MTTAVDGHELLASALTDVEREAESKNLDIRDCPDEGEQETHVDAHSEETAKEFDIRMYAEASDTPRGANDDSVKDESERDATRSVQHSEADTKESTSPRHHHSTPSEDKEQERVDRIQSRPEGKTQDFAEAKANARRIQEAAQPGAKRGGRKDTTRKGLWSGLVGRRQSLCESGDIVEAEWKGSGWWYVGYVQGQSASDGTPLKKGFYHVVFADGDEADVSGKHLKQLGPPGHTKGSAGTLPRHVVIADLGSGSLHRDVEAPGGAGGAASDEKKGKRQPDKTSSRRKNRQAKQPNHPSGNTPPSTSRNEGGVEPHDWWATGTPYAFQPRVPEQGSALESFERSMDIGSGNATHRSQPLMRIVQPRAGNPARGERVFFLA